MASAHPRILVVEDDSFLGDFLCELLTDADYEVDGPYRTLSDGMAALARAFPDFAVLDINLGRNRVDMLAKDLDQYGIGYAFCSGGAIKDVAAAFPNADFLPKPVDPYRLLRTVQKAVNR